MRRIRNWFALKGFAVVLLLTVAAIAARAQQPAAYRSTGAAAQPASGHTQAANTTQGGLTYVVKPQSVHATAQLVNGDQQPIGFTGYIKDAESGLYYAKARYYDPRVGRFITQDPEAGNPMPPPSLHRYLYAYANPTVYADPSGRCADPLCAWGIGYAYAQDDEQRAAITRTALNTNAGVGRIAGAIYEGSQLVTGPLGAIRDASDAAGGNAEAQARWGQRLDGLGRYQTRMQQAQEQYGQLGPLVQLGVDFAEGVGEHFAQWNIAGEKQDWFAQGQAGTRLGLDAATLAGGAGAARGVFRRAALAEGTASMPRVIIEGANGDVASVNFARDLDNDLSLGFSRGGHEVASMQENSLNIPTGRPTPRQSEIDVGGSLPPGAREQVSFKGRSEVPYGTAKSVRPDWCVGATCSVEVKNYNLATNQQALIKNVSQQAIQRQRELPLSMTQQLVIDIRGQSVNLQQEIAIRRGIVQSSNVVIAPGDISFKRK